MIPYIIIAVLVIAILILLIVLLLMIRSTRELGRELKKTRNEDYNRQLKVALINPEIENLAAEINKNLDYQKELKVKSEKSRKELERSIADIAHDLRTPLTVVMGNLQLLENEDLSPEGRDRLEISRRKTESLKGMVDEFFELSVLESKDSAPVLKKTDVTGFLSEFIIENEVLIRSNDLSPDISFPEKSIFIRADKDMLSRVFGNILGNILKYAKNGFELYLEEDCEKGVCRIRWGNAVEKGTVIDTEHIFDRTYRADKARSAGSAGLGLYIARLLTERQKGTIEAFLENEKIVFEITFLLFDHEIAE